ncbi:regulator of G-protein signaling 14 [Lampris incognitus]|uniref:regulator of G-protein signaling 14 n=1 Tax=Lampris incognitus TaxID=2546036 RepID=UPI0024B624B4|nr:regulator of G-protein signaling 14 [Lampris incognitus]
MAKNNKSLGIPVGYMSQAVSDGELNMSVRGCGGSSSSLPGTQAGESGQANSVLSWAVSFEKLLEDSAGVRYFTAFLKSEVSAENILFWKACERYQKIPATCLKQLKEAAYSIYQTYLADSAPCSVNIDDTAKMEEKDLEHPTPDMFNKAQAQIFKLMKMDSYRRFVRSPLYQSCTLASVEGKPLPSLSCEPCCVGSWEDMTNNSPTLRNNKKNKKTFSSSSSGAKSSREKDRQKRGSWGDMSQAHGMVYRKESQTSVKSTSSVELGSLCRQMDDGASTPRSPEQFGGGGGRLAVEGGYCCVYLPDGSASLAPTRQGMTLRGMLSGLCEKRGFPLNDIVIYLHGNDKPLSLDQNCSVLRDQQVSLDLRVKFVLDVVFTGKTSVIMVKSSKTLQDALSVVLQKHQLKPQDTVVTMSGSNVPLSMSTSAYKLANKILLLDRIKGKDQNNSSKPRGQTPSIQGQAASPACMEAGSSLHEEGAKTKPSKNHDMDGLLEMLTRAQGCRVDDQRGLLTKEHLELPLFLHLPLDQTSEPEQKRDGEESTTSGCTHTNVEPKDHIPSTSCSNGGTERSGGSASCESRDDN